MNRLFKDLSVDKIKLIYEFDKTSPLFSRVGYYELNEGNYLYANEILEKGLEIHHDYATAYIIYALAKAYAGDEHRAKEALEKGMKYLSSHETFEFYKNKIAVILEERNLLSDTKRPAFTSEINNTAHENTFFKFEDKLDVLAQELSKAKIKVAADDDPKNETPVPEYSGKKIVSETLAQIYISQKNYEEAIAVYKKLIELHPEKEDAFIQKIVEIETLM